MRIPTVGRSRSLWTPEALCHTFGTSCQHDPFMVAAMGAVAEIWGNWSLEWFRIGLDIFRCQGEFRTIWLESDVLP